MNEKKYAKGEEGWLIWEAAVALPTISLLLAAITAIFMYSVQSYLRSLAEAELQQEIQLAFQRVVDDCSDGSKLEKFGDDNKSLVVVCSNGMLGTSYNLHKSNGVHKLIPYGNFRAPLTGDHAFADVDIKDFGFHEDKEGLYRIWLEGYSRKAGNKYYRLVTSIYLPPKKSEEL